MSGTYPDAQFGSRALSSPSAAPQVQVIVGADGGIGSAYLNTCLVRAEAVTAKRTPDVAGEKLFVSSRRAVSSVDPRLIWLQLDYEARSGIEDFVRLLSEQTTHIDTLVIATGLLHGTNLTPEKNLSAVAADNLQRLFAINAAGPLALLAGLQPLLKQAIQPKVAVLSAQVGSIEDNSLGGWYSYRVSKAALNMGIKTAAIELARWKNNPVIVAIHPGTTHSPLSRPFVGRRKAPVQTAATAASRLRDLIATLGPEQSGSFLTLDGKTLPW